ncbi:hypothetical protein BD410DRAFT_318470 [Rickenella mellea]|uniref:Uncharacterized protein n=1 Tax=Rickenella mellea TaxID=50990 RepID=A0A4Y7Q160_9AGAM|nr:hypothetical protein BD410DRAFT_318470 [Rickenella mellea]
MHACRNTPLKIWQVGSAQMGVLALPWLPQVISRVTQWSLAEYLRPFETTRGMRNSGGTQEQGRRYKAGSRAADYLGSLKLQT